MKKWAPIIVSGAILAYFFLFRKKGASGAAQPSFGSANQADNARRTAAQFAGPGNSNNQLLGAGIGALGGLLSRLLGSKGGGGGSSGGGLSLGGGAAGKAPNEKPEIPKAPPTQPQKPASSTVNNSSNYFEGPTSEVPGWTFGMNSGGKFGPPSLEDEAYTNPAPAGTGSGYAGNAYDYAYPGAGTDVYGLGADYAGAGTPEYGDWWNDPFFGFAPSPYVYDQNTAFNFNGSGNSGFSYPSTDQFDSQLFNYGFDSSGGNPNSAAPGYDYNPWQPEFYNNQDFSSPGYDPTFPISDPYSDFYDWNNFDYSSGGGFDYSGGSDDSSFYG